MLAVSDNLAQCFSALRGHKLRASLTILGLTMGVATLITVMTIVQGANLYVEQKIANLGTDVFQIARTPFAVTDFDIIIKALKFKKLEIEDMNAVAEGCNACQEVGARPRAPASGHDRATKNFKTSTFMGKPQTWRILIREGWRWAGTSLHRKQSIGPTFA